MSDALTPTSFKINLSDGTFEGDKTLLKMNAGIAKVSATNYGDKITVTVYFTPNPARIRHGSIGAHRYSRYSAPRHATWQSACGGVFRGGRLPGLY